MVSFRIDKCRCLWHLTNKNHFTESDPWEKSLFVATSMLAKTAISCSLAVMAGCTADLVTGNRKKTAVYSVLAFSRFWLVFGPMILATGFWVGRMCPPSIMGGLTILNGVLSLLVYPKKDRMIRISSVTGQYKLRSDI